MRSFIQGLFLFTLGLIVGAAVMDRVKGRASDRTRRMLVAMDVQHARGLAHGGDVAGAREAYIRAVLLHPDSFDAHLSLGMFYDCLGEGDNARDQYARAIASYARAAGVDLFAPLPQSLALAHARLGRAESRLGHAREARQAFDQASTIRATALPEREKHVIESPEAWMEFLQKQDRNCTVGEGRDAKGSGG